MKVSEKGDLYGFLQKNGPGLSADSGRKGGHLWTDRAALRQAEPRQAGGARAEAWPCREGRPRPSGGEREGRAERSRILRDAGPAKNIASGRRLGGYLDRGGLEGGPENVWVEEYAERGGGAGTLFSRKVKVGNSAGCKTGILGCIPRKNIGIVGNYTGNSCFFVHIYILYDILIKADSLW